MNDDLHGLAAAYAVDAVDDVERARFEVHLSGCAECRDEVASLRAASSELATVCDVAPPRALKAAIMRELPFVRPLPPALAEGEAQIETQNETQIETQDAPAPGSLEARRADRARGRPRVSRWLAGVAAAMVLAVAGLVWQPWKTPDTPPLSVMEQVLQAPDAKRYIKNVAGATATLVRSARLGRAVVVTDNMPASPNDKVYQLWFKEADGTFVPAGLMPPQGAPRSTVALQGDAGKAVGAGITVEPAGGSKHPTTPPVVLFDFA